MHHAEQQNKDTTESSGIWLTSGTTGKAFRPGGNPNQVSEKKRRALPDRFQVETNPFVKPKRRTAAKKLLAHGCKGQRLVRFHGYTGLYFHTLSARELGATGEQAAWLENAANYNNPACLETWVRLLDNAFPNQPYAYGFHVGDCGRIGAHVMAGSENAIPNPIYHRNPERRKHVTNTTGDFVRVLAYLKAKQPPTPENVRHYQAAVKAAGGARHLPQHSGIRGFQAVKRVRKPSKNIVGDGVGKKVDNTNGPIKVSPTMTIERLKVLLSDAFGPLTETFDPPRPTLYSSRPQPQSPGQVKP